MKFIKRSIQNQIVQSLQPQKVIVLLGARRTGKTVLLNQIIEQIQEPFLLLNGENMTMAELLANRSPQNYRQLLGDKKVLLIDEAQKIDQIGKVLKLMVDEIEGLKIIATGSSAFDLENLTGEPLTGRKKTFRLFPLSEVEYLQVENRFEKRENMEARLIFGNYPELHNIVGAKEKSDYLQDVVSSYLLKDILVFENIRNSSKIFNLLRLIAYQIGSEVSYQELGKQLGMSKNTVEKYLDLLSKVFVIHKVGGFSKNLRKEIVKNVRWYFYDNGIRNTIIANLNPLRMRNDVGTLWENYIFGERIKFQHYNRMLVNNFFWRTYDQQEIDWVEEREGKLFGYEFKWNPKKKVSAPSGWRNAYPDASFEIITPGNYFNWVN